MKVVFALLGIKVRDPRDLRHPQHRPGRHQGLGPAHPRQRGGATHRHPAGQIIFICYTETKAETIQSSSVRRIIKLHKCSIYSEFGAR